MKIGVPKEIKDSESRVGMVPAGARILADAGHTVLIQAGAGMGSGIPNEAYLDAGAKILDAAAEVYGEAEMIVKVKEPLPAELPLIPKDQVLFTYLHLAPAPELTRGLLERGCVGVAYETIQLPDGSLPLLAPMSEVAGRLAPQVGAHYLEKIHGGSGILLGGVPGVGRGRVTIIGGGVVGANAARIAVGLGANVSILDTDFRRLTALEDLFGNTLATVMSNHENVQRLVATSDLVIGSVLIAGEKTPALVSREMIASMRPGSVVVDVAIDQGGCFETSKPTTHQDPVYLIDGVIHYCVTNMPGVVARTATFALTNVTLPYVLEIASKGLEQAVRENPAVMLGVNLFKGHITCSGVADSLNRQHEPILELIG